MKPGSGTRASEPGCSHPRGRGRQVPRAWACVGSQGAGRAVRVPRGAGARDGDPEGPRPGTALGGPPPPLPRSPRGRAPLPGPRAASNPAATASAACPRSGTPGGTLACHWLRFRLALSRCPSRAGSPTFPALHGAQHCLRAPPGARRAPSGAGGGASRGAPRDWSREGRGGASPGENSARAARLQSQSRA